MGNAKRLFDQLKSQSAKKVTIGGSLALLGSKYTIDCMELGDTTKFVSIMTTGRVKALGLKSLLESGMKTAPAVEWIHRQSVKTVYSLLELVKSTPEQTINVKIVEILETGPQSLAAKLIAFLNCLEVGAGEMNTLMPYLKLLLEAPITGETLALLLESKMNVKVATQDSRYLATVGRFIANQVEPEHVIILMEARQVLYRLVAADDKLVEPVALLVNSLVASNKLTQPVLELTTMLDNCNESARLREILIDADFNAILIDVIEQPTPGRHIGRFLSQTGLSIKELQLFSPSGDSMRKMNSLGLSAGFLTKFISAGLKVTDLGNIVRIGSDELIAKLAAVTSETLEVIRKLIKKGARSNEIAILIGTDRVELDETLLDEVEKSGIFEKIKKLSIYPSASTTARSVFNDNVDLIHPRFNTLNLFYEVTPHAKLIHSPYYYNMLVPPGLVDQGKRGNLFSNFSRLKY